MSKKTIHKLRQQAQAKGIKFDFSDDELSLAQKIETVDNALIERKGEMPPIILAHIQATAAPSKDDIHEMLAEHVKRGLKLTVDGDTWYMKYANKEDTGTVHQPAFNILRAADRVLA